MSKVTNIGSRLHSVEQGNVLTGANEILDDTKGKKQNVINSETDAELLRLENEKQNILTFDNAPTEGSNNPVKSGGVYAADKALSDAIEAILLLIPSAATALNKLADKAFVNSSVSTETATFRGTYNVVTDLELAYDATHEQIAAKLGTVILTADNNDYAYVQIPVSESSTDIEHTERYKFNGTAWAFEYDLNTSGFTAAQWEAINSTITTVLVQKLAALPTATELAIALSGKQDVLTFDNTPTIGSNNPVKSGGIKSAINDEKIARENADGLINQNIQSILNIIPTGATSSNKLVDVAGMNAAISVISTIIGDLDATFNIVSTDGHITLHVTQENGLITSVEVQSTDIASAADLTLLTNRMTTAEGNINTLTENVSSLNGRVGINERNIAYLQQLYDSLQQSKPVPVTALPETGQQEGVIYRLAGTTYYSDYMWNGSDWVLMATYNNAVDPRPKKGSQNLVTSGGVFDNMGALDVSELNATENPHTLATYADLSAALAAIPSDDYKKGGMSIKFVHSSDNKYVQYLYHGTSTAVADFTNIDNWEKINLEKELYVEKIITVKPDGNKRALSGSLVSGDVISSLGGVSAINFYADSSSADAINVRTQDLPYKVQSTLTYGQAYVSGVQSISILINGDIPKLQSDVKELKDFDAGVVKKTDIINNLTNTASDKPLSANQGKILNEKIPQLVNDLTTGGTTKALAAEQGKVLNGKFGKNVTLQTNGTKRALSEPLQAGDVIVSLGDVYAINFFETTTSETISVSVFNLPYTVQTTLNYGQAYESGVSNTEIKVLGGLNTYSEGGTIIVGSCNTEESIQVKVITTINGRFVPQETVVMCYLPANTHSTPRFNIDGTGYKFAYVNNMQGKWDAGWYLIIYDKDKPGYRLYSLNVPIDSVTQNSKLPVTSGAVYAAIQQSSSTPEVDIALPDTIYAVVGDTLQIYYDSIFKVCDYNNYDINVICNIGHCYPRYYELTPVQGNVGEHEITFKIRDNYNNILGTATKTLKVVAATQPVNSLNVLCIGSSLTNGGEWAAELKRRLTASGGTPAGNAFTGINFVGRMEKTSQGTTVKVEATGGYRTNNYVQTNSMLFKFNFNAQSPAGSVSTGAVYKTSNNVEYTVTEINLTEGVGNISCTSESTNDISGSGTLTKVSGDGAETLNYSSSGMSGNPFAYNGQIDIAQYAQDYCDGQIDVVVFSELLASDLINRGSNVMYLKEDNQIIATTFTNITTIRNAFKTAFPNVKFIIAIPLLPDKRGGLGVNYGAHNTVTYWYGIKSSYFEQAKALKAYIETNELENELYVANWLGDVDSLNDFRQTTKPVNPRSSVTEVFGQNGVHPGTIGYMQMADSMYRCFVNAFCS